MIDSNRNDRIERELNRINHTYRLADEARKGELLTELNNVIDEIERLEDRSQP